MKLINIDSLKINKWKLSFPCACLEKLLPLFYSSANPNRTSQTSQFAKNFNCNALVFAFAFVCLNGLSASENTGFFKGRYFLELYYGKPIYYGGSLYQGSLIDNNKMTIPSATSSADIAVLVYSKSDKNNPSLYSRPVNYGFDYAISNKFSIGVSIRDEIFYVKKYSSLNMPTLAAGLIQSGVVGAAVTSTVSQMNLLYVGLKGNIPLFATFSSNVNLGYHFIEKSKYDPFVRFHFGQGFDYLGKTNVYRFGLDGGLRYFFGENFYALLSADYTKNYFMKKKDTSFISSMLGKPDPVGSFDEVTIQAGAGFAFSEFPSLPSFKCEEKKCCDELNKIKAPVTTETAKEYEEMVPSLIGLRNSRDIDLKMKDNKLHIIFLNDAVFDVGSDALNPKGEEALKKVISVLAKTKNTEFQIEGHTDNLPITVSKFSSNWELASLRALTVLRMMEESGISEERLSAVSYASGKPYKPNSSPEGRQANRRVVIVASEDITKIPGLKVLLEELNKD